MWWGSSSPEARNAEGVEQAFVRDEHHVLRKGLCHEHAVEGIAVLSSEGTCANPMLNGDGQRNETFPRHHGCEIIDKRRHLWKFANPVFGRDFPGGGGADEHLVGGVAHRNRSFRR